MLTKLDDLIFTKAYAQQIDGGSFFGLFTPEDPGAQANARGTFGDFMTQVFTWVLAVVAIIAFIYLIINGVKYITAGGDAAKATEARNGILNAIIGIVVIVIAFFILRFAVGLGDDLVTP